MSTPEMDMEFVISGAELDAFFGLAVQISSGILGEPSAILAKDSRDRLLNVGDYAKLSRTVINGFSGHSGFVLDFEHFSPEECVMDDEDGQSFEGQFDRVTVDTLGYTSSRTSSFGKLLVDQIGDITIEVDDDFDFASQANEEPSEKPQGEFESIVCPGKNVLATDFLHILDVGKILLG